MLDNQWTPRVPQSQTAIPLPLASTRENTLEMPEMCDDLHAWTARHVATLGRRCCFRNLCTHAIWQFHFLVVCDTHTLTTLTANRWSWWL